MKKAIAIGLVLCLFLLPSCSQPGEEPASSSAVSTAPVSSVPVPASSTPAQAPTAQDYTDYLIEAAVPVSSLEEYPDIQSGLAPYSLILLGEHHGNTKTYTAELEMLRYLNKAFGVKRLFLEQGYCEAYLVNLYLESGDEQIIQDMVATFSGTFNGSVETVDFYKGIYALNQTLPAESRITTYPGDIQHSISSAFLAMQQMLPQEEAPAEIAESHRVIADYPNVPLASFEDVSAWLQQVREQDEAYQSYMGEQWATFKGSLSAIETCIEYYSNDDEAFREEYMARLVTDAYETAPDEKWLGCFGSAHTVLNAFATEAGDPALGNYLAHTHDATKGKVASITLVYSGGELMDTDGSARPMEEGLPMVNAVAPELPDDITLCPLDREGSPFGPPDVSLESQQYLLIIRDTQANTQI